MNEDDFLYDESENALTQTVIQNRYSFYCLPYSLLHGADKNNYEGCIKLISSFQTVEHFWRIYNHLVRPNDFKQRIEYHLFKSGIKPTWEDPQNKQGGKWSIQLKKGLASRYWEELVLAIIGEQFDVGHEICGAVISCRTGVDIISVWNKNSENIEARNKIRDQLRRILRLPNFITIEYKKHMDFLEYTKQKEAGTLGAAPSPVGTGATAGVAAVVTDKPAAGVTAAPMKNPAWRSPRAPATGTWQQGESPRERGDTEGYSNRSSPRGDNITPRQSNSNWKSSTTGGYHSRNGEQYSPRSDHHSPRSEIVSGTGDPVRDREIQSKAENSYSNNGWSKSNNTSPRDSNYVSNKWHTKTNEDGTTDQSQEQQVFYKKRFENNPLAADKKKVPGQSKADVDMWTRGRSLPADEEQSETTQG